MLWELVELSAVTFIVLVLAWLLLYSYDCEFIWKWYDLWVGMYVDWKEGYVYVICFTVGFRFSMLPKGITLFKAVDPDYGYTERYFVNIDFFDYERTFKTLLGAYLFARKIQKQKK